MQRLYAYLLLVRYVQLLAELQAVSSKISIGDKDQEQNDKAETYSYDANNRVRSITDSNSRNINYEYNTLGNKTKLTYPDGATVSYTYDNANRLSSIINGGGRTYSYQYDSLGRRTKLTMPNGTSANYSYDNNGRLTNLSHKTTSGEIIDSFEYTHDKVGNRLTKTETDVKFSYNYDNIYRLLQSLPTKLHGTGIEMGHKAEDFTYDAVGNRSTGPETKDTYTYNQGNQLTNDRKHQYQYDKNGNLIKKTETDDDGSTSTFTYVYDYENRLIKVIKQESNETKTVSFKYDPFGRRIEKKVEGIEAGLAETKTYSYVYDNEDVILEYLTKTEDGKTKTETTRYIQGPGIDEPLAIERKGEVYYYHADGLGSITALTDKKQKSVESYTYDSFGEVKRKGDKVKNTFTFTGREWDEEIGLYYYRARYYDPKIGRFVSFDPILHPTNGPPQCCGSRCRQLLNTPVIIPIFTSLLTTSQALNPFVYVTNRPINRIDPFGLREALIVQCPQAPPGYVFIQGKPKQIPIQACIQQYNPDTATTTLICPEVSTTCEIGDCVYKKEACPEETITLEGVGICYKTNHETI